MSCLALLIHVGSPAARGGRCSPVPLDSYRASPTIRLPQ